MAERTLRLYDTQSNQIKPLETIEPGHLRMYSCGPTVSSRVSVSRFRSLLTADLIVRTARILGWRVTWVTNITDVGHLANDKALDGQGEDRMELAFEQEREHFHNVWELADHYSEEYKADWRRLNLVEPTVRPKASQHIREQIFAARALIANGQAYVSSGSVYFNVRGFPEYGKLSNRDSRSLLDLERDFPIDLEKRSLGDFAVWKTGCDQTMQWHSPFGWGYPGWHLECSVMARTYLGDTLDLHTGGEDQIFPHHECEIAQSESLTGKPLSNHWVHTRELLVEGHRIPDEDKEHYTVQAILNRGVQPLVLRWALIAGHFRRDFCFSERVVYEAEKNLQRIQLAERAARRALAKNTVGPDTLAAPAGQLYEDALDAMCENLNVPIALAKLVELGRTILREERTLSAASAGSALDCLQRFNSLLGVVQLDDESVFEADGQLQIFSQDEMEQLLKDRAQAKKAKDYAYADALRSKIEALGIELRDTPSGDQWVVKRRKRVVVSK